MRSRSAEAGFTLLDSLAALAVMGVILVGLASVSGQWLPHWRRGLELAQNAEKVAQALDRVAADLAAAQFAHLDTGPSTPLFRGEADAVAFVRTAIGPGATPRLEVVRIGAAATGDGVETQRSRAAFAPGGGGAFRDAATLLRPPFQLRFAYRGDDGAWLAVWNPATGLPRAVRLTVLGLNGLTVAQTVAQLHVTGFAQFAQPNAKRPESGD